MPDPILNEFYYLHQDAPVDGAPPDRDFSGPDFLGVGISIAFPDDTLQGNAEDWQRLDDDTEGFVV